MTDQLDETLTSAFERMACEYPSRIAVRSIDDSITYGELASASKRLAGALLRRLGRRPEPVAIFTNPGVAYVASVLGVMKAGKIFSPIDPLDPAARVRQIVADLGARLVLVDPAHRTTAEEACGEDALVADAAEILRQGGEDLAEEGPSPDDSAWIIYTSGSTGRPKGVAQNHRNAVAMTRVYTNLVSITAADELTLLHPALTWDLFGALVNGAGLHPYDPSRSFIVGIGGWLEAHQITVFRAFPTTFRRAVAAFGTCRLPLVRLVHVGGEAFTASDVQLFRDHFERDCSLLTLFGSSEAGIVTAWIIGSDWEIGSPVPVGRPIEAVGVRVYDEAGREVMPGEVGEIGVASSQLFTGYWGRPEQTSRAFHPTAEIGGRRVFLTGDLGAMRPDGLLVHHGRKDFQVKVLGYRVELGEIENALQTHSQLKEVVVAPYVDTTGQQRLAAYYTSRGKHPHESDLRRHLAERLPVYMHPHRYVPLESLPLTPNGKTDRSALPRPQQ